MNKKLSRSLSERSPCPVSTTLDLVGDKWTLLIIRHRNKDFQQGVENIPSNILASRLKMLLDKKLIYRTPYQNNPVRYEYFLTEAGEGLLPVIKAMANWGRDNVAGTYMPRRLQ